MWVVGAGAPPPAPSLLRNASFEDADRGLPAGWEVTEGARDDPKVDERSQVALDREFVREGTASLRLAGGGGTTSWRIVRQRVAVAPGQRVSFRVAAKCAGVRKEGRQTAVAGAMLDFRDAADERVEIAWSPNLAGTADWTDLRLAAFVPEKAASLLVCFFLSQSGTVWFDDARLAVAPGSLDDDAGRAAAFDALEEHLRATYPFFGLARRPRADPLFATWRPRALAVPDEPNFVQALRAMLGDLDDRNVWLRRGKDVLATATPSAVASDLDPAARRGVLTEVLDEQAPLLAARIGAGAEAVGYVEIASWALDEAAAARLDGAFERLRDCRALVLDVRANAGGDPAAAERVASRFAAEDVVWARARVRDPSAAADDAFLPPADLVLSARAGAAADRRPVAVLQGRRCAAVCEHFLLMARALPTVTTVGARSRGAAGGPRSFVVVPGLTLFASSRRLLPPDADDPVEGRGVVPEVEVTDLPRGGTDPVLARALELLRG